MSFPKRERLLLAKKIKRAFLIVFFVLFLAGVGRKAFFWFSRDFWDGKSQKSFAISTLDNGFFVFIFTPQKETVAFLKVPGNSLIEVPNFGVYQAQKLFLLADQEKNGKIVKKSLEYTLEIPIDFIVEKKIVGKEDFLKEVKQSFFPPHSLTELFLWGKLFKRETVWKKIDLESFTKAEEQPDGSIVLNIDYENAIKNNWEFLTDPLVRREGLEIEVFNLGNIDGLGRKVSRIIENFGGLVVGVTNSREEISSDCLLVLSDKKYRKSLLIKRLTKVLDCEVKEGAEKRSGVGDIQLLVKGVKI